MVSLNKGNIHNQGDPNKRIYLNEEENLYLYPNEKYIVEVKEFGSMNPYLEEGDIISTATGKVPYDSGMHQFVAHTITEEPQYPCKYYVKCHTIGYNYDQYLEGFDEGLHGYDYYVIDKIIEKKVPKDYPK